jgi:hypothetical protein
MRRLERPAPLTRIRLWSHGQSPDGQQLPPAAWVAEWAGQAGHPTSYGLLGIALHNGSVTFSIPTAETTFEENLAGANDVVRFGLPEEYRAATAEALSECEPSGWQVLVAAHGEIGSSPMGFRRVAAFLVRLTALGKTEPTDAEIWVAWDDLGAI